jgi:hypothetical protein
MDNEVTNTECGNEPSREQQTLGARLSGAGAGRWFLLHVCLLSGAVGLFLLINAGGTKVAAPEATTVADNTAAEVGKPDALIHGWWPWRR